MLPKSVRLFLFAAFLTSANAHGITPRQPTEAVGPAQCAGGTVRRAEALVAFAGCRAITGDLAIDGTDLSDLSALSQLRSVSGALVIRDNGELTNLDGLERLERAGSLTLESNGLYGTRGLGGLRTVGTLVIASNPRLISLRGFHDLERAGSVTLRDNPRICAHFGLFPSLQRIEKRLAVTSNRGLSRGDVAQLFSRAGRGF